MRARPDRYISLLVSIALTVAIIAPSSVASGAAVSGVGRSPARRSAAVTSGGMVHKGTRFPVKTRTFGTSGASAPSIADAGLPEAAADTTVLVDPLAPSVPGELVVALDSVLFAASSERALEARGATVEKLEGDSAALLAKTPAGMSDPVFTEVAKYAPGVAWVQPNYIYRETYTPGDPKYSQQWGLPRIGAPAAWDLTRGDGVLVAVVDTGVDYTHHDLASQVDTANDWDFINGDSNAMDDMGHGTHVSGIIAATMDNGVGGAGVAPRARILPVKVLDSKGSGTTIGVSAGVRYAADNGAKIINLSLAGPSDASMGSAVAYAQSRGCVVVAAAGNDGSSGGASYPALYDDVIGVGATTSTDAHASFSNWGTGVDIAAPGVNILSTLPTALYPSGYGSWSGTSMATPFVSGVAALVMSAIATTNPDVVIPRLLSTAQDLGDPEYFGKGLVRADLAVESPVTDPDSEIPGVPLASSPVTGTLDVATDRDDVYSIYLAAGQTLEASMTGSPALPATSTDFDLYLYPPDATTLEDTGSVVAGSWSPNSAEHFVYTAPVSGEYYIDVSAWPGVPAAGSYTLEWHRGGVSDDNIPGVALPPSPVNGSLDTTTDEFDVYHVDLAAGEQLSVYMAGPPSPADYDLLLYGPGSTSIYTDIPLATRESTLSVETMRYVAKTSGTFYLAVRAWEGSGKYQMHWVIDPYSPDDNIPGIAMPPSSFEATVGGLADDDDVYKVFLQAGQTLDGTVTTEPQPYPYYPYLFLYPPTATDVEMDSYLEGWLAENGVNYFSHVATSTGYFYVDLYSLGDPVGYTLQWSTSSRADDNLPGVPAPLSPVHGNLGVSTDTDDVYRIHAHAGQWISASLTGSPSAPATTTDFDLYLFPPGSTSTTSTPLAVSDGGVYPKSFALKAPTSGDYYLQAHAFAGEGTYSLAWSVRSFATVYKPVAPSRVTHSHHFTVYGYVAPRHRSGIYLVTLKFYKRDSHGVYQYHNSVKARRYYYSTTKTKYRASVSLPHKGAWRVRAMHSDSGMPDFYSVYDYITVR